MASYIFKLLHVQIQINVIDKKKTKLLMAI